MESVSLLELVRGPAHDASAMHRWAQYFHTPVYIVCIHVCEKTFRLFGRHERIIHKQNVRKHCNIVI